MVNGNNILHIEESSYFPSSIELGLNQNSIQPGETGIVSAQIDHIQDVLIIDPEEYQYVRALFFSTWFGIDFCHGITDMTVIFHFPPGVQTTEVHLHRLPPGWFGEPIYDEDELGQLTMTLNNPSANGFTQYLFEISFPKSHIPESAIVQLNQLDTMYSYAYNKRGLEYLQSNDFENAYEDFSSAIAIDNELSEAYALRGEVIWRSSTNYDDALVNLNKSIELDTVQRRLLRNTWHHL